MASWRNPDALDSRRRALLDYLTRGAGGGIGGQRGYGGYGSQRGYGGAGSAVGAMGGIGGAGPMAALQYNPWFAQIAGRNENFGQGPQGVDPAAQAAVQGGTGQGYGLVGNFMGGPPQPMGGAAPRSMIGMGASPVPQDPNSLLGPSPNLSPFSPSPTQMAEPTWSPATGTMSPWAPQPPASRFARSVFRLE